jgi:probable rRNA maturation factor
MEISVRNLQRKIKVDLSLLKEVTGRTLRDLGYESAECGVLLVNDRRITELNRTFRKVAAPTDVLAFSMQEGQRVQGSPNLLGDVVISAERALSQAMDRGHSLERELSFLLVHGLLHLLGWDDTTKADRRKMLQAQEKILKKILPEGLESHRPPGISDSRTAR